MKKTAALLVVCAIIFSGCQIQKTIDTNVSETKMLDDPKKEGDSSISGLLVKVGDTYNIVGVDGKHTEVDSYKIDLSEYVNKQVVLTGQYSGDTLFVGSVGK